MPIFLSEASESVKQRAEQLSMKLGHFYVGCEHIFLAILDSESGLEEELSSSGVDVDEFREHILNICGPGDDSALWKGSITTPRLKRVLKIAEREAEEKRAYRVELSHIIAAICREGRSVPVRVMESFGVDPGELRRSVLEKWNSGGAGSSARKPAGALISQPYKAAGTPYANFIAGKGKALPPVDASGKAQERREPEKDQESREREKVKKKTKTPTLDKMGRDLVQMARDGKVDPIVGRKDEIRRMIQTLTKKAKNNPIIIGEAGVGKTAVVYGLAQRIAEGRVPDVIKNKELIEVSMAGIVAGTKHRGEFEERMQKLIEELSSNPDIMVFIDEIHTIMGAGDSRGGMDAGNILKPYLARGEITVIGATTIDEYRKHIEKDPALERRFQPIMVDEPSEEDTVEILNGLKTRYEKHHGVNFSPKAILAAVKMSVRYIPDRNLPDKAIDLMDEAAARSQMGFVSVCDDDHEEFQRVEKVQKEITEEDIAEVVSLWTGIPAAKLTQEESERLLHMEDYLRSRVVGQEVPVRTVAQTIRMVRMGLSSPNRPSGVFLFLGPTGVGKTELAKALAEFLFGSDKEMVRLDMSEYMEKHAISRMIGSPPGYVGHEEEGQLTKAVRTKPYSVVLLDEVEKAHPEIFDLFLQVFDDGRLTDSKGRTVNFTNTILIMTSNIGCGDLDFSARDANPDMHEAAIREFIMAELKEHFRPEFLNRIDEIVIFNPLSDDVIISILEMNIKSLADQLRKQREIEMIVEDSALRYLSELGYDPNFGARPMKRAIQNHLAKPLAESMLANGVDSGDTVYVYYDGAKLVFDGNPGGYDYDDLRSSGSDWDPEPPRDDGGAGSGKKLPSPGRYNDDFESPRSSHRMDDGEDILGTIDTRGRYEKPDKPASVQKTDVILRSGRDSRASGGLSTRDMGNQSGGFGIGGAESLRRKPVVDMKKPRVSDDNPMRMPPSKREPILKQRTPDQNISGIAPMKGPMSDPFGMPEDLNPDDFATDPDDMEQTRPRKTR